jgi:hypothetical protein
MPFCRHQLAETDDFIASQEWLSSPKRYATVGSLEIQIVHYYLIENIQSIHPPPYTVFPKTLRIQAVLTAQRTTVEGDERSYTLPIGGKTVAADSY